MDPSKPKLSVLIPTLGREDVLLDTIAALHAQTVLPDEIIVSDQNQPPIPGVDRRLKEYPRVRHIRTEPHGVVWNYNSVLAAATSEVVLFLDDDIIPEPKLIENHLRHYTPRSFREGVHGVAGRVEQPQGDPDPASIRVVGRYHRWLGGLTGHFNARHRLDVEIAPGGNMSFLREKLLEAGAFDQGFVGNGYFFESDGSYRVHRRGGRIVFDPEAGVRHLQAPMGGARIADKALHHYYYVRNGIRMYRRHSSPLGLPAYLAKLFVYSLLKALKNRDARIATEGIRGIAAGMSQSMEIAARGRIG